MPDMQVVELWTRTTLQDMQVLVPAMQWERKGAV